MLSTEHPFLGVAILDLEAASLAALAQTERTLRVLDDLNERQRQRLAEARGAIAEAIAIIDWMLTTAETAPATHQSGAPRGAQAASQSIDGVRRSA